MTKIGKQTELVLALKSFKVMLTLHNIGNNMTKGKLCDDLQRLKDNRQIGVTTIQKWSTQKWKCSSSTSTFYA